MPIVRTRIAPSPTGFPHVGTAYVCLLNYAFTRKNHGELILKVDDSDTKRNIEGAEVAIYSGLQWLGFDWDEGPDRGGKHSPFKVSEKLDTYKKYADKLIAEGKAYEDSGAIRFKNPGEDLSWKDQIAGEIKFPGGEVTDYVIIKSDGFPTYNFYTVVDDHEMEITHVIRGEEHISNTPRQLATYKALGWKHPEFAHFPTLRNAQHKKLSKRTDPVDLRFFREQGYLPEALVNFLGLLGWSHPKGKEIFSLDEFVENFSLERVRRAGPIFDTKKLDWLNAQYIVQKPDAELATSINQYSMFKVTPEMAALLKTRINKLSQADELLSLFERQPQLSVDLFEDPSSIRFITTALEALGRLHKWTLEHINLRLSKEIEQKGYKTGDFYMSLRLALAGKRITPPINESMVLLGQDAVVARLETAQKVLLEKNVEKIDPGPDTD